MIHANRVVDEHGFKDESRIVIEKLEERLSNVGLGSGNPEISSIRGKVYRGRVRGRMSQQVLFGCYGRQLVIGRPVKLRCVCLVPQRMELQLIKYRVPKYVMCDFTPLPIGGMEG